MRNLRRLFTTPMLVVLLGALSACIVEMRPDHSMLIYIPPPVTQTPGAPNLTLAAGTIPDAMASPLLDLIAAATTPLTTTVTTTVTAPLTGPVMPTNTMVSSVTVTMTVTPTNTVVPSATVTITATQSVSPTGSPTLRATAPTSTMTAGTRTPLPTGTVRSAPSPIGTGTRSATASPTVGATATARATATPTLSRTPTATRQPTATATRSPTSTAATPPPTATRIPSTVFLGRHQGFAADTSYYVVGEVLNGDAYPVFNVKVIGSFYDSNNNLVAAQESRTFFPQIEPELSSPFKLQVANSSGNIDRYELTLTWDEISIIDYEELAVVSAEEDRAAGQIAGELRNDGSVSVQEIVVVVTLYSAAGEVVNVLQGTVSQPVLGANETVRYTITLPPDITYERFEVQAQGVLKLF